MTFDDGDWRRRIQGSQAIRCHLSFPKRRVSRLSDCSLAIPPGKLPCWASCTWPRMNSATSPTRRWSWCRELWIYRCRTSLAWPRLHLVPAPAASSLSLARVHQSRLHPARRSRCLAPPGEASGHPAWPDHA